MANNLIQIKRTSVSGRAANSSTLVNPGELALNMVDGIMYSTNGSTIFEIGANTTNSKVTTALTVGANAVHNTSAYYITGNTTTAPTMTLLGTGLTVGNTTITGAPQIVLANTSGTTTINSNFISTTSISGNLTGNVAATTISGNLTGNVSSTTTSASANVTVGANVLINLSSFSVAGNTTTAPTMVLTGAALNIGNTSITGTPQIVVANTTATTTINANFISTTSISGNLTGNVSASYANITGQVNTATLYAATSANIASAVQANATGVWTTGTVNGATLSTGAAFTANSTVVNAVAYYSGTLLVANSTVSNATHLGGTAAAGYQTTAGLSANVATLTSNNATNAFGKTEGNLNVNSATTALTANNSTNLGGTAASGYQTTAGLSANVATLTSNNATNLGGVAAAAYLSNTANKTISGGFAVTAYNRGTVTTGNTYSVDPTLGNYQYYTNNGAHTLAAPSSDCAIDILVTNGASAGSITFSGFTVGASTGSVYATTNAQKYILSIRRINGVSTYSWYAMQ